MGGSQKRKHENDDSFLLAASLPGSDPCRGQVRVKPETMAASLAAAQAPPVPGSPKGFFAALAPGPAIPCYNPHSLAIQRLLRLAPLSLHGLENDPLTHDD